MNPNDINTFRQKKIRGEKKTGYSHCHADSLF